MKFIRLWGPVILWMAVIFFFSSRSRLQVSPDTLLNFLFFKSLHVAEYAILFILNYRATRSYTIAFLITIVFAFSDEMHQTFVPTREGRLRDVIIDGAGALIAWISIKQLFPILPKKLRGWGRHWLLL